MIKDKVFSITLSIALAYSKFSSISVSVTSNLIVTGLPLISNTSTVLVGSKATVSPFLYAKTVFVSLSPSRLILTSVFSTVTQWKILSVSIRANKAAMKLFTFWILRS